MKVRKTTTEDIKTLMMLYENARCFMAQTGNPTQWGTGNPPQSRIDQDIREQKSYVCTDDTDNILGVFYFAVEEEPTYACIYDGAWASSEQYGVVHRIASSGKQKGVGQFCLNWAYEQIPNIRIDTHKNNKIMQALLHKLGFTYCGIIHLANQEERLAFQKIQ